MHNLEAILQRHALYENYIQQQQHPLAPLRASAPPSLPPRPTLSLTPPQQCPVSPPPPLQKTADSLPRPPVSASASAPTTRVAAVRRHSAAEPGTTLPATAESLAMPFKPYTPQVEMIRTIMSVLESHGSSTVPVVATELPTGCGKTLALLSCVLRYQAQLKRMTRRELQDYMDIRAYWHRRPLGPVRSKKLKNHRVEAVTARGAAPLADTGQSAANTLLSTNALASAAVGPQDDQWIPPATFFKHFRVSPNKPLRIEVDITGSAALRRQFTPPPCTIFYATRTHAQIQQAVHELRKLTRAGELLRVNVLGSRGRYCINPTVVRAKAARTLQAGGNNLGEVCDKLVSLGQCACVEKYDELACSAIGGPIAGRPDNIWDLEDLVAEGIAQTACPYYAARDLAFYADINFCSYSYLLDPLIRHECRMEGAVSNYSIVIFDEAHNIPAVCQDALSVEGPLSVLVLLQREVAPLACSGVGSTTLSYPRQFQLTDYTLVELFTFLLELLRAAEGHLATLPLARAAEADASGSTRGGGAVETSSEDAHSTQGTGESFARALCKAMREAAERACSAGVDKKAPRGADDDWLRMLRQVYGIIMCLGVTFNPFHLSIFGLSMLKRWLLAIRFLLQKPSAFALRACDSAPGGADGEASARAIQAALDRLPAPTMASAGTDRSCCVRWCELRCLDGSLGFHHLLRSTHRVVLASGTLSPFSQLGRDLNLTPGMWRHYEGTHVVGRSQYALSALTRLPSGDPLRCTYAFLGDPAFVSGLAQVLLELASSVPLGGVLVFAPNYSLTRALLQRTTALARSSQQQSPSSALPMFEEPRNASALPALLNDFRSQARRRTALLFAVYRGKVSEGIDFTDEMARLVICVGVPLQPLRAWRVVVQRAYCGPAWYTCDAVRAVNQALGRCLRHAGDYGAVVLLDDRYAQPDYARLLSGWCRDALTLDHSVSGLSQRLGNLYDGRTLDRACGTAAVSAARCAHTYDTLASTGALTAASIARAPPPVMKQLPMLSLKGRPQQKRARASTHTHAWRDTAIKLLYEERQNTADVTLEHFTAALADLDKVFLTAEDCTSLTSPSPLPCRE